MCGGTGCGSRDMNLVAATVPGGVPVSAKATDYCCNSGVDERMVTCGTGEGQGHPPCFIESGERKYCEFLASVCVCEGGGAATFLENVPGGHYFFVCIERKATARFIPFGVDDEYSEMREAPSGFGWALSIDTRRG